MHQHDRAGTLASLLYKAEKLSACIIGTLITQYSLHGLKWDLLKIKAVSLSITEFIFASLQNPLFIDRSVAKDKGVSNHHPIRHLASGSSPTLHVFLFQLNVFSQYTIMELIVYNSSILSVWIETDFSARDKASVLLYFLLHLAWLDTINYHIAQNFKNNTVFTGVW